MPLTKLHSRDIRRIDWTVRTVEGAPIVHPNETRKRRGIMSAGVSAIHITGYGNGNRTYTGRRVRANSAGDLIDPWGYRWSEIDEEDIDFDIALGTPSVEVDVRYYWPRLLSQNVNEWWGFAMPLTLATADETIQRWYIVPPFGAWCEREAQPGMVSDLPFEAPGIPGQFVPPKRFTPLPPGGGLRNGDDDLQRLIEQQNGGRPCCGDD